MSDRPMLTTWEMADGEPIWGEFDFLTDRLWIDEGDWDEPVEFVRTEWVAVRRTKSWRSEDRPVCSSCHGKGETSSGGECGQCRGGYLPDPVERVLDDERWPVNPPRDPAASASLDELVAMNIAGDIEAVADMLDATGGVRPSIREQAAATRLRRIAAGVRGSQGALGGDAEGRPVHDVPTPWDPHGGER